MPQARQTGSTFMPMNLRRLDEFAAAGWSGIAAGTVYLAAQMTFTLLIRGDSAWVPLQRISALLLGPDAVPPPADMSLTIAGMALLIHFALAFVYGRCIGRIVSRMPWWPAVLAGAAFGLAIYVLNFELIAPVMFPWFDASRGAVTLFDHALFGAVAAALCVSLRAPSRADVPA